MPRKSNPTDLPVWYHPSSPLGSAVRYIAGLSARFNWVGIYVLKGKTLELGPYIGAETDHTRIFPVRDRNGKILGQIDIDSHTPAAFGSIEEENVRRIARELGELWPA